MEKFGFKLAITAPGFVFERNVSPEEVIFIADTVEKLHGCEFDGKRTVDLAQKRIEEANMEKDKNGDDYYTALYRKKKADELSIRDGHCIDKQDNSSLEVLLSPGRDRSNRTRSDSKKYEFNGDYVDFDYLCDRAFENGISRTLLLWRIREGWSISDSVNLKKGTVSKYKKDGASILI